MLSRQILQSIEHPSVFNLNGRLRNEIFIGDHPNAAECQFLIHGRVIAHHRTQRPSQFKAGYVLIATPAGRKYFDRHERTIDAKGVYLFRANPDVALLARGLAAMTATLEACESAAPDHLLALCDVIYSRLVSGVVLHPSAANTPDRNTLLQRLRQYLRQLWLSDGVRTVEDVVAISQPKVPA